MGFVVRRSIGLSFFRVMAFGVLALLASACAPKFNFSPSVKSFNADACTPSGSYQLAFTTQPSSSIAAGAVLPTGGTVEIQDSCGNPVTTGALSSATVALSDSSGNGNLAGVTSVTLSGGVATIPNSTLTFETTGTTSLAATTTVSEYGTLSATSHPIAIATPSFSAVEPLSGPDDPNGDVDGNGTSARIWMPEGVTTDGTYVYVWETAPSCVVRRYELASPYTVDTWIGRLYHCGSTDGALGTNKINGNMNGSVATDGTNLYFEDSARIRAASLSTGTTTTIAGTGTAGDSDNAFGTSAEMNENGGLLAYDFNYSTQDSTDTLYFGDTGNCLIRMIDLTNSDYPVTTIAGDGTCGTVDNANPLSAEIGSVNALAADSTYLYFADNGGRVRTMNWSTGAITTVGRPTVDGILGLAVVGSTIYVASDSAIYAATIGTWSFSRVAGQEFSSGEFDGDSSVSLLSIGTGFGGWVPSQAMLASGGLVYFADGTNGALRVLDPSASNTVTTLAGTPDSGQGWILNTTGADARYESLYGVVSDGTSLFAWDGWLTNQFHVISMADGSTGAAYGSGWGLQSENYGQDPMAMIGGTLYFASQNGCEVVAIDPYTWTYSVLAGGTCGEAEGSFSTAEFTGITGIASDHQNHLYVQDNDAIKVLNLSTQRVSVLSGSPGTGGCVTGTASASRFASNNEYMTYLNGALYFASDSCFGSGVIQVNTSTGASALYAGSGSTGYVNGTLASAKFGSDGYWGIPITTDGQNLYLFDSSNAAVREIDATGTVSTLFGGNTAQYQIDGSLSTAAPGTQSNEPQYGIYYGYGKLYLVDYRGVRVVY